MLLCRLPGIEGDEIEAPAHVGKEIRVDEVHIFVLPQARVGPGEQHAAIINISSCSPLTPRPELETSDPDATPHVQKRLGSSASQHTPNELDLHVRLVADV